MKNKFIFKAIRELNPSAKVTVRGDDVDACEIEWHDGTAEISRADIKTKADQLKSEHDALAYSRERARVYPGIKDFMEAYTEKEIGGDSTKWNAYKTAYNKVRTDNPKE